MKKTKLNKLIWIMNFLAFIGVIIVNTLANALPINGLSTGDVSALYPNLFVPAGFTFSIWGIIYAALFLHIIYHFYQSLIASTLNDLKIELSGIFLLISSFFNISWIFAWHYQKLLLSLIFMVIILFSLIALYLSLNVGKNQIPFYRKTAVELPVSIYLAWISVATVANFSAYFVSKVKSGFGLSQESWTLIIIIVIAVVTVLMILLRNDLFFFLTVEWALGGILAARLNDRVSSPRIVVTLIVLLSVLPLIMTGGMIIRKSLYGIKKDY